MQKKIEIMEGALRVIENALRNVPQTEKVLLLGTTKTLKVSREEAEVLLEFIQKYSQIKTENEFERAVKKDYDDIPYIIGAPEKSEIGKFQAIIEACIH